MNPRIHFTFFILGIRGLMGFNDWFNGFRTENVIYAGCDTLICVRKNWSMQAVSETSNGRHTKRTWSGWKTYGEMTTLW